MKSSASSIRRLVQKLRNNIHHIPTQLLEEKPREDKWSRKEILGHLIDSARYNLMRFNEILESTNTYRIKRYSQDHLVKVNDYQNEDLFQIVNLWQSINKQIAHCIGNISEKDLEIEIDTGEDIKNLGWLIDDYIVHMEHHLDQILNPAKSKIQHPNYHVSREQAIGLLQESSNEFAKVLEFADLEIEYYKPELVDNQNPHTRDEVYIVASGNGEFIREGQNYKVVEGDMLFVKAHEEHKFFNFSNDFATWVIFYGLPR